MTLFPKYIPLLSIFLLMTLSGPFLEAQPVDSWSFSSDSWERSDVTGKVISSLSARYNHFQEGQISFVRANEETDNGLAIFRQNRPGVLSLSFWIRIPEETFPGDWRLFWSMDNAFVLRLTADSWLFISRQKVGNEIKRDIWKIPFDGASFSSLDYLFDAGWHQVTIQYNSRTGKKEFYLDGQTKPSWQKQLEDKGQWTVRGNGSTGLAFGTRGEASYPGDLGPVTLYPSIRKSPQVDRDFQIQQQRLGISAVRPRTVESRQQETADLPLEYPEMSGADVTSASRQLMSFPAPRYFPGHTLLPNFNWVDPVYMAGWRLNTNETREVIPLMLSMVTELSESWNYTLPLSWSFANKLNSGNSPGFAEALIQLANERPDLPVGLTLGWAHIRLSRIGYDEGARANISNFGLKPEYYLQNETGKFLDHQGEVSNQPKVFRPTAPASLWSTDGQWQQECLESLLSRLTRPVDIINENGEVPPWPVNEDVLALDPVVRSFYQQNNYQSYEEMYSEFKTLMRSRYRDGFLDHPRLKDARFSWYAIDGGPYKLDRFHWDIARRAMLPINGQYYSTPNFYVRWPDNWRKWKGPWRGWEWISITRKEEILAGDQFFSPFIGAGWDRDPTKNVRPTQWLGLLKCLNVVGAEFFYTGVFNARGLQYFALPQNYIWQLATPSYAQAVLSRYEDIFRDGNLLTDSEGVPILEYDAGDPRILFTARKHDSSPEYILAGTIQPSSNTPGNVPEVVVARPTIDGMNLTIPVRRQGSVYHLDLSDRSKPVLRQLDAWHEAGHPIHWSKGHFFEAEVTDYLQDCDYVTTGNQGLDFSNHRTVLTPNGADPCAKYQIEIRESANLEMNVSARSIRGSGRIQVMLDDEIIGEINVSQSSDFQTLSLSSRKLRNLSRGTHLLSLHLEGASLEVDNLSLQ